MPYRLRQDITFCSIGKHYVFLDLARNRYFQLREDLTAGFRDYIAGGAGPDDTLAALSAAGVIEEAEAFVPWRPDLPHLPRSASLAIRHGTCSLLDVGLALFVQHRVRRRLTANTLSAEFKDLRRRLQDLPSWQPDVTDACGSIVRAFERSKLIQSPADLCLPRSIALVRRLAGLRLRARLVVGVKLAPFAAHAWAQVGDEVLNDSFEEVAKYTPIFAL